MRVRRYRSFIRRFNIDGARRRLPRRASFELTYRCNFKCVHCFTKLAQEKRELDTKEVFSILDQMRDLGIFHITFTGGEIFSRPDIIDILGYTRRLGFEVSLLTNGSLITENIADWLIENRIRDLEISFHGAEPKTFEDITQVPGSFERVLKVVRLFKEKGVIVTIKTCVLDLNLDVVDKVMELAKGLGVSFRYSRFVVPRLDCDKTPISHRVAPEEFIDINKRFKHVIERIKKPKRGSKIKKQNVIDVDDEKRDDRAFNCLAGRSMIFVNPCGEMKPCIILPVPSYDILKGSLKDGWEYIKSFVDDTKRPQDWRCNTCELKEFCSICPARAYLNIGDMFGCPEYFREVAQLSKERYEDKVKGRKEAVTV